MDIFLLYYMHMCDSIMDCWKIHRNTYLSTWSLMFIVYSFYLVGWMLPSIPIVMQSLQPTYLWKSTFQKKDHLAQ